MRNATYETNEATFSTHQQAQGTWQSQSHSHAARDNGSSAHQVDVINLVSDDDRTPVRRPRPVRASDDLEIVRENLMYTEGTADGGVRRGRRNRTALCDLDSNREVVVTNFDDATMDKEVCMTQHVERLNAVKHYVHPRPACGTFAFAEDWRKFCSKCYCVICEIPASECRGWRIHGAVQY